METRQKGRFAELRFEQEAAKRGWIVSRPTVDARYDLLVDDGERIQRVQVKYASSRSPKSRNGIQVGLRRWAGDKRHVTRNYTSSEIDAVVVYLAPSDEVCWIPIEVMDGRPSITIQVGPTLNNQRRGVHFAAEFRL